jgi:CRP-like cAMP-binding protein
MEQFNIEKKELFSLLTPNQIAEISEIAIVKEFEPGQIIFDQAETATNLFVLLEGEISLRHPGRHDISTSTFSLEIENIVDYGTVFGPNSLFGLDRYFTRARVMVQSKVMILNSKKFLEIIQKNGSEIIIMSYLAKVYFHRYINAMKEFQQFNWDKELSFPQ